VLRYGHFKCRPIELVEALEGLDEEESRRQPDRTAPAGKGKKQSGKPFENERGGEDALRVAAEHAVRRNEE
jgi:hypothetical protein